MSPADLSRVLQNDSGGRETVLHHWTAWDVLSSFSSLWCSHHKNRCFQWEFEVSLDDELTIPGKKYILRRELATFLSFCCWAERFSFQLDRISGETHWNHLKFFRRSVKRIKSMDRTVCHPATGLGLVPGLLFSRPTSRNSTESTTAKLRKYDIAQLHPPHSQIIGVVVWFYERKPRWDENGYQIESEVVTARVPLRLSRASKVKKQKVCVGSLCTSSEEAQPALPPETAKTGFN